MAAQNGAPTRERGTSTGGFGVPAALGGGLVPWGAFVQQGEHVPEWHWPASTLTAERMLTDSQVWALYSSDVLALLDYVWAISPHATSDATYTAALAADLGLPVGLPPAGEDPDPPAVGAYRFGFLAHLSEALLALAYGHYYFEMVGPIGDDGLWHLERLAPRAPQTLMEINVFPNGDLASIRQATASRQVGPRGARSMLPEPIPAEFLAPYVWWPDARNRWVGRSMLRPMYRHYLINDVLMRVDAVNHQRAGGVPTVETDQTWQGADLGELAALAQSFGVDEEGGAALPPGAKMVLQRLGGTDIVGSMRYHDEAMARVWGAMIVQLGQSQTGSRALGATFADLQALARRAMARWLIESFRESVVRSWWRWNVPAGEGGEPPTLVCRPSSLEQHAFDSGGPAPPGGGGDGNPPVAAARRASPRRAVGPAAAADGLRTPARELRRQPYDHEVRAAVDFAALDATYEEVGAAVEALYRTQVIPAQTQALADAVTFTKAGTRRLRVTRAAMARLVAPEEGRDELAALLARAARDASREAVAEAAAQGVELAELAEEEAAALVADHAQAVTSLAAESIGTAASRRAVQVSEGRSVDEVAGEVEAYLRGLQHRWTVDQLHGAVQMAQNAGRFAVFAQRPQTAVDDFYASELLDVATCAPCVARDGTAYGSLEAAMRDYPTGGYKDCQGGPRCRGTVVAVLGEQ